MRMEEPLGERVAKLEERTQQYATHKDVQNLRIWVLSSALAFLVVVGGTVLTLLQSIARLVERVLAMVS